MGSFRSGRKDIFGLDSKSEIKNGTVSDIKASPERGKKRIIAREKSARGQSFAVDIPMKEARKIERKETYSFNVEDKPAKNYGARVKKTGFRTYNCDEMPEDYSGKNHCPYKSFSGTSRMSSDRTKFQ